MPTLFNYTVHCILGQALQNYPVDQPGTSINVSNLVNVDDIVLMSKYYGTMQGHHVTPIKHHAATVSMFSNALINFNTYPWEQRLAVCRRMMTSSSTSAQYLLRTTKTPRTSETGLTLLGQHSLIGNPVLVRRVNFCCVQRVESTRQSCVWFLFTIARLGQYKNARGF